MAPIQERAGEPGGHAEGTLTVSPVTLLQIALGACLLLGYLATASFFDDRMGREYAVLTAVSIAAAAAFVASAMHDTPVRILRIMVLTVFLVGYYLQFYWLIVDPRVGQDLTDAMLANLQPAAMLDVFREATWTFAALAVLATVLDRVPVRRRALPKVPDEAAARIARNAVFAAAALLLVILPVMASQNIGLMGEKAPELPFRIAGWSIYGLRMLVPGLFLLVVAMGERLGGSRLLYIGLGGLVLAGVADMLITTSKASLVLAFIRVLLLLLLTGGLTRPRLQLGAVALVGVALLFPAFAVLRAARLEGLSAADAIDLTREGGDRSLLSLVDTVRPSVMRVSGADTLLPLVTMDPVPEVALAGFVSPIGISSYITVVVHGRPLDARTADAPGLLGWFHLALGRNLVVPGVLLLLLLLELAWRATCVVPFVSRDVVLTLLAGFLLTVLADGIIESIVLPLVVIAGTAVALETLVRLTLRRAG